MLEQAVELPTVEGAPRTVEVIPRFRLLPRVIVVQELNEDKLDQGLLEKVILLQVFLGGDNNTVVYYLSVIITFNMKTLRRLAILEILIEKKPNGQNSP